MKKALITGITGQDGSYLAEFLLEKGYEVHGIIRRASVSTTERIDHIIDKVIIHEGDLSDSSSIIRIVLQVKPDEIYNLAAQSHVQVSFDAAEYTGDAAAMMKLLPAKGKEYWEDDKNLTEKQLQDYMQNRMNTYGHKYDEVSVKVDDNSNPIENSKVTERVNSNYLDNYGITADEVIYFAECELTVDGEERDEGNDVYVYKYNGRWYSIYPEYHLIEDTDSE